MKAKLQNDMKQALRDKDKLKLSTVRGLLSAFQYEEMQKGEDLKEEQAIAILKNEIKKRKETLEYLEKDNRADEIKVTHEEIKIIELYLPSQMSEEEIRNTLTKFKTENPEGNMGLAMKYLKDNFNGQYDGKIASNLAKELF